MTPHEFIDFFLMRVGEMLKRKLFIRIINLCLDKVNKPWLINKLRLWGGAGFYTTLFREWSLLDQRLWQFFRDGRLRSLSHSHTSLSRWVTLLWQVVTSEGVTLVVVAGSTSKGALRQHEETPTPPPPHPPLLAGSLKLQRSKVEDEGTPRFHHCRGWEGAQHSEGFGRNKGLKKKLMMYCKMNVDNSKSRALKSEK